jgi:D-serine deaminase-like pyridoxal phosphate-dependent protein
MKKFRDLPTPCLILDLDRFEGNLDRMSRFVTERAVALRPHSKTHKCPQIAQRQIARGAIGICVATIAEAEVMVRSGIQGLLITAELVGQPKLSRFVELLKRAPNTMLVVDNIEGVSELQTVVQRAGLQSGVLIDLDIGQNRTGIKPGEPARELADTIARSPNLRLKGLCAYAGHVAHASGFETRLQKSRDAISLALETRDRLRQAGHDLPILSVGSTGTYNIDSDIAGVTEIQAGSYVFMDVEYRQIGSASDNVYTDFSPALTVLATVIHRSQGKAIVDAGLKAFATDRPFGPELLDVTGVKYEFAGDEHGRLVLENPSRPINIGDTLRFMLPHCDPNVNLYDRIHCIQGDDVVDVWSIMDRSGGYF